MADSNSHAKTGPYHNENRLTLVYARLKTNKLGNAYLLLGCNAGSNFVDASPKPILIPFFSQ